MNGTNKVVPTRLAVSCAIALAVLAGPVHAQFDPLRPGYLIAADGQVVSSGTGLCVHAGTAEPPSSRQCDMTVVSAASPQVAAPEPPAQVAAAPEVPAPAPPAPSAPPVIARVTLDADALFDFDHAELRSDGQQALNDFLGKLQGINAEVIAVLGFTDRIGTDAYNLDLSERRAVSVTSYLEGKGIAADKVRGEGRGNTQPVTKTGECDAGRNAEVIACLQPDRRVEIEVSGTAKVL
jgi:OOP family OmpA-OmpF porin